MAGTTGGAPLTSKTSLSSPFPSASSSSPVTTTAKQTTIADYQHRKLQHPPHLSALTSASKPIPTVEPLSIKVPTSTTSSSSFSSRTTVPAFLHLSPTHSSTSPPNLATILLSGASGGLVGPSSIYLSIADKLPALTAAIPVLRLDYRYPARNAPCCADVTAGMDFLETAFGIRRFVLVGWSFGGAPVFTVAGTDERVVGCATVASQTAETEGIRRLAPRPVLLMHGTGDRTLSPWCSQRLYEMYGDRAGGQRTLKLFEGDDHALTGNADEAERLICEFVVGCAGVGMEEGERREVLEVGSLVEEGERVELMRRGGELRGAENVE